MPMVPADDGSEPQWHSPFESVFGPAPAAVRFYLGTMMGDRSNITEKDFQDDELDILRETAEKAIQKGKNHIGYGDYGEARPFDEGTQAIVNALTDKRQSLAFTLGMARVKKDADGSIVINDNYHFAAKKAQVEDLKAQGPLAVMGKVLEGMAQNGLLGVGNVIGNLMVPQDDGRDVQIRIPRKNF